MPAPTYTTPFTTAGEEWPPPVRVRQMTPPVSALNAYMNPSSMPVPR
jgi:hypothetical protein